jgi:hypothetical protein
LKGAMVNRRNFGKLALIAATTAAVGATDFANTDRAAANQKSRASLPLFDGPTYEDKHDRIRLSGQLARVYNCMSDERWRSLAEIRAFIKSGSEAGISARLRDLRKKKFGSHVVEGRRRGEPSDGAWEYRLIRNRKETVDASSQSEERSLQHEG